MEPYREATITFVPKINNDHPYKVTIAERDEKSSENMAMQIIRTMFFSTEEEALSLARKYKVKKIHKATKAKKDKKDGGAK